MYPVRSDDDTKRIAKRYLVLRVSQAILAAMKVSIAITFHPRSRGYSTELTQNSRPSNNQRLTSKCSLAVVKMENGLFYEPVSPCLTVTKTSTAMKVELFCVSFFCFGALSHFVLYRSITLLPKGYQTHLQPTVAAVNGFAAPEAWLASCRGESTLHAASKRSECSRTSETFSFDATRSCYGDRRSTIEHNKHV